MCRGFLVITLLWLDFKMTWSQINWKINAITFTGISYRWFRSGQNKLSAQIPGKRTPNGVQSWFNYHVINGNSVKYLTPQNTFLEDLEQPWCFFGKRLSSTMVVAQMCTNLPHTFASVLDPPNKILIFFVSTCMITSCKSDEICDGLIEAKNCFLLLLNVHKWNWTFNIFHFCTFNSSVVPRISDACLLRLCQFVVSCSVS